MVDLASTIPHRPPRRRKKIRTTPSPALLASLAAFIPPAVLARPVLLPFLYPSISTQSTSKPSSSKAGPSKRSPAADAASTSTSKQPSTASTSDEPRRADHIAYNYRPDDNGHFQSTCWSLHGQSNCPRNDSSSSDPNNSDGSNTPDTDQNDVVPGATPDFPASSTTVSPTATPTTSTSTTTSSPTTTTSSSAATVSPYTMTFEVSNIPPGWQKSGRTAFYSKRMVIGFSVTLAALICLTIVLCVIWRIRVARERRESEKALREKKKELGLSSQLSSSSSWTDDQADDEDRESTRQRGLRRRRANVRATDDQVHDSDADEGSADEAVSERNAGRKKRTAFMRTFSGKMLVAPGKWRKRRRRAVQEEEEQGEEERREREEMVQQDPRPVQRLGTQNLVSQSVEVPRSPPPPPSPRPHPQEANHEDEENDDDDPTSMRPPAYRRRNFGTPTTTGGLSARAMEKRRAVDVEESVPEEYMYLAGVPTPHAVGLPSAPVLPSEPPRVVRDEVEDDLEYEDEVEERGMGVGVVTAHLATDDKAVLERLRMASAPPDADLAVESAVPNVPAEEDVLSLETHETTPTAAEGSSQQQQHVLPPPPTITSAHLFAVEEVEGLPKYEGRGVVGAGAEKGLGAGLGEVLPSAPPVESVSLSASAPPLDEELGEEVEEGVVVEGASAPRLEDLE